MSLVTKGVHIPLFCVHVPVNGVYTNGAATSPNDFTAYMHPWTFPCNDIWNKKLQPSRSCGKNTKIFCDKDKIDL